MLDRKLYQTILNNLLDSEKRVAISIEESFTWYISDFYAIRVPKNENIFDISALKADNLGNFETKILSSESHATPLSISPISQEIKRDKKKITLQKFTFENGKELWMDKRILKLFPSEKYSYKGTDRKQPVFSYDDSGILTGIMLPFAPKESDQ